MKNCSGLNALDLKKYNILAVLQTLKNSRHATIRQLAVATGLSSVTVGNCMQILLSEHKALECDLQPSQGGRPSKLYRFNELGSLVLILYSRDVDGQDLMSLRVADLYGTIIHAEDHVLSEDSYSTFTALIDPIIVLYPAIAAIGFGLPGIEFEGSVLALDYKNLIGSPIVEYFSKRYNRPLLCENDVNAAAWGSGLEDDAPESEVYLYFPHRYAPGAGIRIGKQILKGKKHYAGEVRWLPLPVEWGSVSLSEDFTTFISAIADVVLSVTAVLAPESIRIFGERITSEHILAIRERCSNLFPVDVLPVISLSPAFYDHFETGLVDLTLKLVAVET